MKPDEDDRRAPPRRQLQNYRAMLERVGFRPSRRLGQNFLLEPELHIRLLQAVAPSHDDLVLEIGAGLGFLTRELCKRCRLVAVEVDARLFQILAGDLGQQATLVHANILQQNSLNPVVLAALRDNRTVGRFLVVANLPYAISGPLLAALLAIEEPPTEMALLVQREFADRLAATPRTKDYGALSAQIQLAYEVQVLRKVPADVFWPRPKVDSSMVHLRARPEGSLGRTTSERVGLARFLRRLFAGRRKMVRNAQVVREQASGFADTCSELLEQRPDALAPRDLLRLWAAQKTLDPDSGPQ